MTQGVHPVVRYSYPADPGACARSSSHPPPHSRLRWPQAPHRQVWSPWNSENPKEEICSECCPLSEDRAPLPQPWPCCCLWTEGGGSGPKTRSKRSSCPACTSLHGLENRCGHGICGDPCEGRHPLPTAREVRQGGNPGCRPRAEEGAPGCRPRAEEGNPCLAHTAYLDLRELGRESGRGETWQFESGDS